MPELGQVPVRIHRVTTRRRTLHTLQCPLEPEVLVAEFAEELPPDVARAVREHIAVCESCGARSQALRAPYQLLASLGSEPVPYVPDLRDNVRARVRRKRLYRGVLSAAGALSRAGALGVVSFVGIAVLLAFLVVGVLNRVGAESTARSTNALSNVPSAGSGILFAQSDKLVTIHDRSGHAWRVAEVLAVDERTGTVRHSLPASSDGLTTAQTGQLPVAVVLGPGSEIVYELTAPDSQHMQALVAFDARTGDLRFATQLTLPGGRALPRGSAADALALSPDGSRAYIGLGLVHPDVPGARVLVVNTANGSALATLSPSVTSPVPMPPPPGSLPVSVFPNTVPKLDATGASFALGAQGVIATSPDGAYVFDLLLLQTPSGERYGLVRRINAATGETEGELALSGDFRLAQMAVTGQGASARLTLAKGSPDAQVYLLDVSASGPTLLGNVPLGGPPSPANLAFSGMLTLSSSLDGNTLYATQNVTAASGAIEGHDLWQVNVSDVSVVGHRYDTDAADDALANGSGAPIFILRGGQVEVLSADLTGSAVPWLALADGHPIMRLLATSP
jgi:hypothetical protein